MVSWRKDLEDLADLHGVTDDARLGQICKTRLGDIPRHFITMKESDGTKLGWDLIATALQERFAKVSPEKLFEAMDVKQGPTQTVDEYAVAVEQSYESVAVPAGMDLDLLKKMTLTRGIRDEELQIKILQPKPETFALAVEQLRDLEDVLRKVRGPKLAKIIEETKPKPVAKRGLWDTVDIAEIAETTIAEKFMGSIGVAQRY